MLSPTFFKLISLHALINSVTHGMVTIPIMTYQRCQYAKTSGNEFTRMQQNVMCTPDFTTQYKLASTFIRSLGNLFDNWLNIAIALVERSITGIVSVNCNAATASLRYSFEQSPALYVTNCHRLPLAEGVLVSGRGCLLSTALRAILLSFGRGDGGRLKRPASC